MQKISQTSDDSIIARGTAGRCTTWYVNNESSEVCGIIKPDRIVYLNRSQAVNVYKLLTICDLRALRGLLSIQTMIAPDTPARTRHKMYEYTILYMYALLYSTA